jgi:hypothetical protein
MTKSMMAESHTRRSPDLCAGFVPSKLRYQSRFTDSPLANIESTKEFPKEFSSVVILISGTAKLWEFNECTTIQFNLGNDSFLLLEDLHVRNHIPISEIFMILPRGARELEFFTYKSGSIYLDFAPLDASTVLQKFAQNDPRFGDSPAQILTRLVSKISTNFDYLILLNLFAGRSFHIDSQKPMLPSGDSEVPAEHFFLPELAKISLSEAYANRKALEGMVLANYILEHFELHPRRLTAYPRPAFGVRAFCEITHQTVVSGGFCGPDFAYVVFPGGDVQFIGLSENPHIFPVQHCTLSGSIVPVEGGLVVLGLSGQLQHVTPESFSPEAEFHFDFSLAAAAGTDLVVVHDECVVSTLSLSPFSETVTELIVSSNRIRSLATRSSFNALALGTEQCTVDIHSLTLGDLMTRIDLEGKEPEKVLLTPIWSFVVVYFGTGVRVFTINGTLVGGHELEHGIVEWAAFSDGLGCDFVAVVDTRMRLAVFEAVTPGDLHFFDDTDLQPLALAYLPGLVSLAVLGRDGRFVLIPLSSFGFTPYSEGMMGC